MSQIFGQFIEDVPNDAEYLILGFSPSSASLKQRWRNNGLSADFLADYLQTFFVGKDDETGDEVSLQNEIRSAVSYISNELLENAMKFNDAESIYPTRISLHLYTDKLAFYVTNSIPKENIDGFQSFIQQLMSEDLEELYIQQLERNALDDESGQSGLGFLTMIQDYSAVLSWKFEKADIENNDQATYVVTTRVQLDV